MTTMILADVVAARHPLYNTYAPEWKLIRDCLAGERAVKEKKTDYLPKPSAWTAERYRAYLTRAHFLNASYRTQAGLTGIAFNKAPSYQLEGGLAVMGEDVDGKQTSIDQLTRDMVAANLAFGRGGLFVDFSKTLADGVQYVINAGRPILRHFEAEQIINWRVVDNQLKLLVLEYVEDYDHDGFIAYQVRKWLELRMINGVAHFRLWSDATAAAAGVNVSASVVTNFAQAQEVTPLTPIIASGNNLDHIPFYWYGSENNDEKIDPAPLADICNINIAHYQADADVSDSSFIAGQPTLVLSNVHQNFKKDNPNGVQMGSGEGIVLSGAPNMTPKAEILTATANTQSAALMSKREEQLAMLGARLVERNSATKTATQAGADNQTDNSILSLCVANVEACLNRALIMAALYSNGSGLVSINKKYDEAAVDSQAFTAFMAAVQSGMMRFIDFLSWQQRNGLIPADEDLDVIESNLMNDETPGMIRAGQMINKGLSANPNDPKEGRGNETEEDAA